MTTTTDRWAARPVDPYCHEAFLYSDPGEYADAMAAFIRAGLKRGEPALVVVPEEKGERIRAALGADAVGVRIEDMADVGANPARIIPAWRQFAVDNRGRRIRGIGEPVYPERAPDELFETFLHENLLNVALPDNTPLWLICPYDTRSLAAEVIAEALRSHPVVSDRAGHQPSQRYNCAPFDYLAEPLPPAPADATQLIFTAESLADVRRFVSARAMRVAMDGARIRDLVLAVNEVATNSVRHGGGAGTLRTWTEQHTVLCEVTDSGYIRDPLVGRWRPHEARESGFGVWIANQLCDLVQIRTSPRGTTVRLHMSLHHA